MALCAKTPRQPSIVLHVHFLGLFSLHSFAFGIFLKLNYSTNRRVIQMAECPFLLLLVLSDYLSCIFNSFLIYENIKG